MNELLTKIYLLLTPPQELLDRCKQEDLVQQNSCETNARVYYAEQQYLEVYLANAELEVQNIRLRQRIKAIRRRCRK